MYIKGNRLHEIGASRLQIRGLGRTSLHPIGRRVNVALIYVRFCLYIEITDVHSHVIANKTVTYNFISHRLRGNIEEIFVYMYEQCCYVLMDSMVNSAVSTVMYIYVDELVILVANTWIPTSSMSKATDVI